MATIHLADGTSIRASDTTRIWDAMSMDATREAPTAKAAPGFTITTARLSELIRTAGARGCSAYVKRRGRLVRIVSIA
jgi:hypothetical protein